jgi:FMN phosphatase YigB (HAD superfamily)
MLDADVKSAGLTGMFEQILSTDQAKTYKPDPRAYQLGVDTLGLKRNEILFVAFAGWDAAGASCLGIRYFGLIVSICHRKEWAQSLMERVKPWRNWFSFWPGMNKSTFYRDFFHLFYGVLVEFCRPSGSGFIRFC